MSLLGEDMEQHGTVDVLHQFQITPQAGDVVAVDKNTARQGVVEALQQGNGGTLAASTGSDERDVLAGLDAEVQTTENRLLGTSGVAEVNVAELDGSINVVNRGALPRPGVDSRTAVEELAEFVGSVLRLAHVGREGEDSAGGLCAEQDLAEADEKLEGGVFVVT